MILSAESQKAIDIYLTALRKQLRALRPEDANDIVEEIHAHILDKSVGITAEGVVSTTLAALGTPDELAARYRTDELLKRAQSTRSPVVSLFSLARWATLSLIGLVTFIVSLGGYALGALLVVIGLFKLIYPHNGGIWFDPKPGGHGIDGSAGFSFVGGTTSWTHPGHEVFGLWLAPACLAVGGLLVFLTFRLGTWCIRKFWRPSALREV
jgi:hypothetical protein